MFNAVRPEEILLAVARVMRAAADTQGPVDDFGRSQLLSASSIARNLAAEQTQAVELLAWLHAELDDAVAACEEPAIARTRDAIGRAHDAATLGEVLGDLLALLRDEDHAELRGRVRRVLAEMVDREVAALAAAPR